MAAPVEILYVDDRRLHSYVDQITDSPLETTSTAKIDTQLGLIGPSLGARFERQAWPRRTIDAIRTLDRHLDQHGLVQRGRPGGEDHKRPWVRETCMAYKVEVLTECTAIADCSNLVFWHSPPPEDTNSNKSWCRPGALCLMQDGRLGDATRQPGGAPLGGAPRSVFSLLYALIRDLRTRPERPRELMVHRNDRAVLQHCNEFATDPRELLMQWGCRVSDARRIQSVYRVRTGGMDYFSDLWSTFAYAIWICEAN